MKKLVSAIALSLTALSAVAAPQGTVQTGPVEIDGNSNLFVKGTFTYVASDGVGIDYNNGSESVGFAGASAAGTLAVFGGSPTSKMVGRCSQELVCVAGSETLNDNDGEEVDCDSEDDNPQITSYDGEPWKASESDGVITALNMPIAAGTGCGV